MNNENVFDLPNLLIVSFFILIIALLTGKIVVAKSFWKKSEASKWAYKIETQIETGSYF